ncbi:MAG: terpene cyclase/mutase family protein [Planctomycetota bacterium]|nr:terpene cyclase/mutase family protein [Planctomycetota bacterium]MDP7252982.1 terpene cyclase/mutase family protein [Planctomycetota bacterium]
MLINPRSPLYRIARSIQAAPFIVFSIGVHFLLIAMLMQLDWGGPMRIHEDLVIETSIIDEEEIVLDPQELEEKLSELVDDADIEDVQVTPTEVSDVPPMELPPDATEEMAEAIEEDGLPGEDELDEALDAINNFALGDGGNSMVVAAGDWDTGGPSGRVTGFSGRKNSRYKKGARKSYGGSSQTENAVLAGLKFLSRYQQSDGRWSSSSEGFHRGVPGTYDQAITGLSLLAFLGAGHTEATGKYRTVVSKAVSYLRRVQTPDGAWKGSGGHWMYTHGICAMAMSEAFGMAGSKSQAGNAAQRAITYIVEHMGDKGANIGGFGYGGAGNDTSVTGWQIMACKSAKVAELKVPKEAFNKFKIFLDTAGDPSTGKTGYRSTGPGSGSIAMTAVGQVCRLFLGQKPKETPFLIKSADLIDKSGPNLGNSYYLYYGTLAQFQMGDKVKKDTKYWTNWNNRFALQSVARQVKTGRMAGSWPGDKHGPCFVTAMNILCLEVYYRYLPVYQ